MNIVFSTLNQTAFLFGLIVIGYILVKIKFLPENAAAVLSKLENAVFIPALVMGTFIENFTTDRIKTYTSLLVVSGVIAIIAAPLAVLVSKLFTKDKYIRNIYTYGLSFSNFGFMGNAVVKSLFPDIFCEYLIFTLPLWILIYLWGVPRLLMADAEKKQSFKDGLKSFVNPMFICMIIGMLVGVLGIKLPVWLGSIIKVSGDCMSPVAMILTGIVVSGVSMKKTFTNIRIYGVSIVRLVVFPIVFIAIAHFMNLSHTAYVCALCSLAMPLGLNTIVIPSALGKDSSEAAGMAVISHLLSCITIPLIFICL